MFQGGANPRGPFFRRPLPGRLRAVFARRRIGVQFLLQLPQLFFRLGQRFLQRRLAAERGGPRAGADLHPVLGHAFERHQPLGHQAGDTLRQQAVEQFHVLCAKVGKGVVIHRDAAAKPTIRRMVLAQAIQFPRAAHRPQGGVQPQGHQDARIGGRLPRTALDRLNPLVQLRQVKTANVVPNDPGLMLLGQKLVERTRLKLDLIAYRVPQPSMPAPRRQGSGPRPFLRRPTVKQPLIHRPSSNSRPARPYILLNPQRTIKFSCFS